MGELTLTLCDTMARTATSPSEMPVGVVTALGAGFSLSGS